MNSSSVNDNNYSNRYQTDPNLIQGILNKDCGSKGLKINRIFTEVGKDPLEQIIYEKRVSKITNPDGSAVFEMKDVEVPKAWSQVATDILAQKYFRKKGVPQYDKKGQLKKDKNGKIVTGVETSIKQVSRRLAQTWRFWGEKYNYFDTTTDAEAFEDELKYMLANQVAAPNSPQWFNTGLNYAYGITGEAQGHYYVDPDSGRLEKSVDAYSRPQPHACFIQSLSDNMVNSGGIFDLVMREARLFKYGSGTGTNFSVLRGSNESLSGGGKSSGLMSFLQVFDRAAGAIKSGGTTRRAAKMVCLDIDHPEVETFIEWKVLEEQKVAALHTGSYICYRHLRKIMESATEKGLEPEVNTTLKDFIFEAKQDHVPLNYVKRVLMLVEQGVKPEEFDFRTYDTDFRSEAYTTVGGQNSNNSIRLSNKFMQAVEDDTDWNLINRLDGRSAKTMRARDLWESLTYATWYCADPGVQFDTTINEWHTCPKDGRINASNPCSEYMFLDDTACNLASLNLIKFYDAEKQYFDIKSFKQACRVWTIVLEISVLMAQFPSPEIAQRSYNYRTLGLGYANLGTLLMQMGIPYDSSEAFNLCGAISAILCGESYSTSAELARYLNPFPGYASNREDMLRVMRNHRRAAYNMKPDNYEDLSILPKGIDPKYVSNNLLDAARETWDRALYLGEQYGYRNAQTTVIAPTGTIGLLMDCDTTGIEPDFSLIKFKKLVGGGYFKIVNQSIYPALMKLGYNESQIQDIIDYCKGKATLTGCPHINPESLVEKGFTTDKIAIIEAQLHSVFELKFAFNKWSLGEDFCMEILNLTEEQLNDMNFNILKALGFTDEEINEAETYVCGHMMMEGAPHLKKKHYAVFDCANRCGKKGERFIPYEAHIWMLASAQPFISGSISKTVNLPEEASVEDIKNAYILSWKLGLKANALYRDGSKLSQALNTSNQTSYYSQLFDFSDYENGDEVGPEDAQKVITKIIQKAVRRKLPIERRSITHKFAIGGHEGYITVGLYEDGTPGELFIKMNKEGSTLSGIMDALALSISLSLQYGVPLEVLVKKFTHTRFEPAGMTRNREIPLVKSIIDYLGRWFALKFMDRDDAKKYHNSELVEYAYENGSNSISSYTRVAPLTQEVEKIAEQIVTQGISNKNVHNTPVQVEQFDNSVVLEKMQAKLAVSLNNEDAPLCLVCGSVMVRNGTCYRCLDCGETSGCS